MTHTTDIEKRGPELLAPAGGPESLRAAVGMGADAVYLGSGDLNARRGAENFDVDGLRDATRYAHLRGARVYLTANVVVLPSEMSGALSLVADAWQAGVDAVIVQDLGLLTLIRTELPGVRIHASTQIDAHNAPTIGVLAELGVSRVTLARELSVAEITSLSASSPVELESFVHGSLCFSHSGQCLMSSMIGSRSANRGLCAQPCRLPYDLPSSSGEVAEVPGRYLLSPKDLAGVELLPALVRSGVAAVKIEGRMKSPEYVATVVGVYRAALDRAVADPDGFSVTRAESDQLAEAFSRGFSEAYLSDIRDDSMMSYQRPNNRGVPIGRVAASRAGVVSIELTRPIENGDTLEFWTAAGRGAVDVADMCMGGAPITAAPAGKVVELPGPGGVRPGDRVFRIANAALISAARRVFEKGSERRRASIDVRVALRQGAPASVDVRLAGTPDGPAGRAEGRPVEAARTRAVSAAEVMEHVGRLGGTRYDVASWEIELDDGVGIGFSELHALRREALAAMEEKILRLWSDRVTVTPSVPALQRRAKRRGALDLVVVAATPEAAEACLSAGADAALVPTAAVDKPREWPQGVAPLLPRVVHDAEVAAILAHGRASTPPVAGNLGVLRALALAGVRVQADQGLNALNPWSAAALADLGASLVWASPELSGRQLAELAAAAPVPLGIVVHGRLELMVAEHCVLQAAGECSHRCAGCARRREKWVLRDRKDYEFPVTTDPAGRAHVYNSVPLDLSRALGDIIAADVTAVRLELAIEDTDEAVRITGAYRHAINALLAGGDAPVEPVVSPSTGGHFHRGVR